MIISVECIEVRRVYADRIPPSFAKQSTVPVASNVSRFKTTPAPSAKREEVVHDKIIIRMKDVGKEKPAYYSFDMGDMFRDYYRDGVIRKPLNPIQVENIILARPKSRFYIEVDVDGGVCTGISREEFKEWIARLPIKR